MEIKFTLTDTQEKCAKTVMADIQSWVENAITVRAEIATLMPQIAQATKAAVADARMRGGNFSKSMVGA